MELHEIARGGIVGNQGHITEDFISYINSRLFNKYLMAVSVFMVTLDHALRDCSMDLVPVQEAKNGKDTKEEEVN